MLKDFKRVAKSIFRENCAQARVRTVSDVVFGRRFSCFVCKHTDQSTSGCCGGRHLGRGAQEAEKLHEAPYRRWSWLGHVLRMHELRLMHRVLLNCVKPTLFADVPNLNVDYAIRMSEDGKPWRSSRPSLHCQPLIGGCNKVSLRPGMVQCKRRVLTNACLCWRRFKEPILGPECFQTKEPILGPECFQTTPFV